MEGGWSVFPRFDWCEHSSGVRTDISPFRRHLHQFLNRGVHLEADIPEGALVIVANSFGANNRGKKEWQLHGVVGIELKHSVDVAVIQRLEIFEDSCLDCRSF